MTFLRFTPRATATVALQQIALAAVLFLLVAGWLQVPDANVFEVAGSVLLALLIAVVAGAGESGIALRLTGTPATLRRMLPGTTFVVLAALLWLAATFGIDHLSANDGLRAGYLNSRFPSGLRNLFSYEHLVLGLHWAWTALRWIVAGLLAAVAFACITGRAPLRALRAILRSGRFWLLLFLLAVVGSAVTDALLGWRPGQGLAVESLSLALRLAAVIVLNAAGIALLLQAMAAAVLRVQSAGTAEPDASQPPTADNP